MSTRAIGAACGGLMVLLVSVVVHGQTPAPVTNTATITRDIKFTTHDGHAMTGARELDRAVYDTSTLDNKVRDGIAAVRVLQKESGVDASQLFLRGISEGTLLAVQIAATIPKEIKGLVLSGVIGDTLKSSLKFMAGRGTYMQHLGHWDARSEERRVGKECRSRWSPEHEK